ncbi:MAG: tetratricopeptide repeat protein [Planctomycetaceae bacterium]|nr:tetratricopeptide repeat protein [Planctomycetaceae bacterium]
MTESKSEWVVSTTDATFVQDVIERSRVLPVVVDFWAEWCQPCRALTPTLEKLAADNQGRFLLVKANTEETPSAAAQFGVQSIPAVFGLRGGEIVDGFQGALPEAEIQGWLQRIMPSEAEQLVAKAKSLGADDEKAAEELLRQAVEIEANQSEARLALLDLLHRQARFAECQELIESLENRGFLEPEAQKIKAAVELQVQGQSAGSTDDCRKLLADNPDDIRLRLQLAESLAAAQIYDESLEHCLKVVQQDQADLREQARQLMVDIFKLLPADSELTRDYRRQLSMALY